MLFLLNITFFLLHSHTLSHRPCQGFIFVHMLCISISLHRCSPIILITSSHALLHCSPELLFLRHPTCIFLVYWLWLWLLLTTEHRVDAAHHRWHHASKSHRHWLHAWIIIIAANQLLHSCLIWCSYAILIVLLGVWVWLIHTVWLRLREVALVLRV